MVQCFAADRPSSFQCSIGNYQMVVLVSISVFVSFGQDSFKKKLLACEVK